MMWIQSWNRMVDTLRLVIGYGVGLGVLGCSGPVLTPEQKDLELPHGRAAFVMRIVDAETLRPVVGAVVRSGVEPPLAPGPLPASFLARSDEQGFLNFEGYSLDVGCWYEVHVPGYAVEAASEVPSDVLLLTRPRTLTVRFLAADGSPRRGARWMASSTDGRGPFREDLIADGDGRVVVRAFPGNSSVWLRCLDPEVECSAFEMGAYDFECGTVTQVADPATPVCGVVVRRGGWSWVGSRGSIQQQWQANDGSRTLTIGGVRREDAELLVVDESGVWFAPFWQGEALAYGRATDGDRGRPRSVRLDIGGRVATTSRRVRLCGPLPQRLVWFFSPGDLVLLPPGDYDAECGDDDVVLVEPRVHVAEGDQEIRLRCRERLWADVRLVGLTERHHVTVHPREAARLESGDGEVIRIGEPSEEAWLHVVYGSLRHVIPIRDLWQNRGFRLPALPSVRCAVVQADGTPWSGEARVEAGSGEERWRISDGPVPTGLVGSVKITIEDESTSWLVRRRIEHDANGLFVPDVTIGSGDIRLRVAEPLRELDISIDWRLSRGGDPVAQGELAADGSLGVEGHAGDELVVTAGCQDPTRDDWFLPFRTTLTGPSPWTIELPFAPATIRRQSQEPVMIWLGRDCSGWETDALRVHWIDGWMDVCVEGLPPVQVRAGQERCLRR